MRSFDERFTSKHEYWSSTMTPCDPFSRPHLIGIRFCCCCCDCVRWLLGRNTGIFTFKVSPVLLLICYRSLLLICVLLLIFTLGVLIQGSSMRWEIGFSSLKQHLNHWLKEIWTIESDSSKPHSKPLTIFNTSTLIFPQTQPLRGRRRLRWPLRRRSQLRSPTRTRSSGPYLHITSMNRMGGEESCWQAYKNEKREKKLKGTWSCTEAGACESHSFYKQNSRSKLIQPILRSNIVTTWMKAAIQNANFLG